MASSNLGKRKWIIFSAIALAVATPIMVKYMTGSQTSIVGSASESSTATIIMNPTDESLKIGSKITFATTYPKTVKNPRIEVLCYQDNKLTFGMAGGVDYEFQLGGGGSVWLYDHPTEPADCIANLYYFGKEKGKQTYNLLATTKFSAAGKE